MKCCVDMLACIRVGTTGRHTQGTTLRSVHACPHYHSLHRFNLTLMETDVYFTNRYRIGNTVPTANDSG